MALLRFFSLLLAFFFPLSLQGAFAAPMDIPSFEAEVQIQKDGSLQVVETMQVIFNEERRGLFRDIPTTYRDAFASPYTIQLHVESVTDASGLPHPYVLEEEGDFLRIRVGDPEIYLTGPQSYRFTYRVQRAYTQQQGQESGNMAEFPWNVTGTWPTEIGYASVTIRPPENISPDLLPVICFAGPTGSTSKNCSIQRGDRFIYIGTTTPLESGDQLTYAIQIPTTDLTLPGVLQHLAWFLQDNFMLFFALLLGVGISVMWLRHGREHPASSVMPNWELPKDVGFFDTVMLYKEVVSPRDMPAALIALATQGALRIEMVSNKRFIFHKQHSDLHLPPGEKKLITALFGSKSSVSTEDLKNVFYTHVGDITEAATEHTVQKKWYYAHPTNVTAVCIVIGILLCGLGIMLSLATEQGWSLLAHFIVAMVWIWASLHMPKKTPAGRRLEADIYGLREYILRADKLRLSLTSVPHPSRKEFDRLLPYAMLFGLERRWTEQFTDVLAEPSSWITGNPENWTSTSLVQSLRSFSSTSTHAFVSAPSSSGSSGSYSSSSYSSSGGSSFSSGGSSGGGFGGGGGGSW